MKILAKASDIDDTLVALMKKYKRYRIATAWASLGSKASKVLLENRNKINKMVVGTHFYQTHPNFINEFINSDRVRFILTPNGIFHPKVYLFSNNENDWACIVGSANFTASALTKNSEVVVWIESKDDKTNDIYQSLVQIITHYWTNAEVMNEEKYHNYRKIWNVNKERIKKIEESYGGSRKGKALIKSKLFSLSWPEYYDLLQNEDAHQFEDRLKLLDVAYSLFKENEKFSDMHKDQRVGLAGIVPVQHKPEIRWGLFGSMVGAGRFKNRIIDNNEYISKALDCIPLHGNIFKSDYLNYLDQMKSAFPKGGFGVATASRLLAIKRPDHFICLDQMNKTGLCEEFGISRNVKFDAYWDAIIERIRDSVWWSSDRPKDPVELKAWSGRAAMLDALFYKR